MKRFCYAVLCVFILTAVFLIGSNRASAASTLTISYPEDGEIYSWDNSMKIRWNTVSGASGYYVTILDTESGKYLIRNEYTRNKYFTATSYLPETPTTLKIWVGAVTSSSQTGAEAFTDQIIFIGLSHEPGVTNGASDNITKTGARLKMSVDYDYGQAITDCGFYIGTSSDEDLMDKYSFKRYSTSQGATTKGTKYMTISGLEPGTKYYYKAYAVNAAGEEISSAKNFTTEAGVLADPVITYPIDGETYTANNSIKLQWKSVSGVDGYKYYIKQLSGEPDSTNESEPSIDDWSGTVSASRTYYTLSASNVKGGYWYKFVVEAYADGMTSGWSDWCYVKVENGTMANPHITYPEPDSTIIGYQDIPFAWNKVSGAEEYTYFVKRLSGAPSYVDENEPSLKSWSETVSASTTHFTLDETEALPGYWYKFVVKASAEGMNDSWSEWVYCYLDEFRLTDPVLTAPANQSTVSHADSIRLDWSSVSGVDGYRYHIKQLSGSPEPENENEDSVDFWSETVSPSSTSYTFPGSNVKGGYWYKFVIEAYSSKAKSTWSNWSYVYVNTAPLDAARIGSPENTATYPGNQNIVLDWEPVDHAEGYTFYIKRLSGLPDRTNEDEPYEAKWSEPTNSDTTSYTLTSDKFIPGYWYKFVIEAYADGMISSWSEWVYCYASEPTLSDPYIHTPASWTETSEGSSITVDWDPVNNASGYRMHYKQLLGKPDTGNDNELAVSGDKVDLGNKTSFSLSASEVIGGYWYKFVVEAYASSNVSAWSNWVYVFVQDNGSLASPVITSPKPNVDYKVGDDIMFAWSKVENAENYTYYVKQLVGEPDYSDDEEAVARWSQTTSASERYFTLSAENIHENTWYKFVVEAKASGYDSGWSKYMYIRIPECEDWVDYIFSGSLVQVSAHAFGNNLLLRTFDASKSQLEVIGQKAFANCVHLKSVFLPESVYSIAEDAFENCPNLTIHCISGSPAEEYALRKGIRVEAHGKTIESDTMQLSRSEWNIPDNDKAEAAVRVNSSSAWTASSDSVWLTLSKSSGTDGANVILKADENTGNQTRFATVTFTCGQATASIRISQNAFSVKECEMKLHPDYWEPSENALTREIVVQNTYNFTVSSNRNWLTYTVSNASITAKVSPDALSGQNTGILTVTCSDCGAAQTVTVSTKGIIVPSPASVTVLSTEPHAVFVSWSPVAGANYIVERSNDDGASWIKIASTNANSFTDDSEIFASTSYKYRITATKTISGVSHASAPITSPSCTTPKEQTISFTGVIGSIGDNGRAKIEALSSVSWNTISGMTYKLSLKDLTSESYVNSLNQTNIGAVNSYSLSGLLTEGHQYRIWVGAYNTAGRRVGQSGERVFTVIKPSSEPAPVISVLSVTPTTLTNTGNRSFILSISASHARTFIFDFGGLKVWEKYDKDNSQQFGYSSEWTFDGADSFGSDWTYQLMKKRDVGFYPEANAPEGTYTITITAYGDGGTATATTQIALSKVDAALLKQYTYPYTVGNLTVTTGKNQGYMNKYIQNNINSAQWQSELNSGNVVICMFEGCGSNSSVSKRANATCVVIKKVNGLPTIVFQNSGSSTLPDAITKERDGGMLHSVDGSYTATKIMHTSSSWHGYAALHIDANVYRFKPENIDTAMFWCTNQINVHHRYWDGLWDGISNSSGNSEGCLTITQNTYTKPHTNCTAIDGTDHNAEKCNQSGKSASKPSDFKDYIQFLHAANVMEATDINLNNTVTGVYNGSKLGEKVGILIIDRTTAYDYLLNIGYSEKRIEKIMGSNYVNRSSWTN